MKKLIGIVLVCLGSTSLSFAAGKGVDVKVNLSTMGNNIAFDQTAIEVPFDKGPVKLTFANQAAKASDILHNVVLLKPGKRDEFVKLLQKNDYDADKLKDSGLIVGMTKTLNPGEKDAIVFTPTERGFYPFICSMPGHGDMLKMEGVLHVK